MNTISEEDNKEIQLTDRSAVISFPSEIELRVFCS